MNSISPSPRLGWGIILFVLLLQFWSRYLPNPGAVFVADDWNNWARSSFYESHREALLTGLQDPNRPLSMAAVEVVFRIFGDQPVYWTMLSVAANSTLLMCLMLMVWGLTGRRVVVLLAGVLFALFPNLTETYHWSTQVLNEVTCALVFYALSGWMWVDYTRKGGRWRLFVSTLAFLMALFSYEAGLLLPAAYLALLPWRKEPIKSLLRLSPFGLVALFYAAWRVTDAFGMNHTWFYPSHMEAGLSLWGVVWNFRELLHWWVGDHLFGAMLNGFNSFSSLSPWVRRGLFIGNGIVVCAIGWLIGRIASREKQKEWFFSPGQVLGFSILWTGAAMAIPILSYTAPRLNVLPALGVSMLAALVLTLLPRKGWGYLLAVPALLAMISNQGTTESYRQAGEVNQRLFTYLQASADDWGKYDHIIFDSSMLRQRLTPGLAAPVGRDPAVWADYQNALLFRGFVYSGMIRFVLGEKQPEMVILHDVENGVSQEGEVVYWHARFNPEKHYQITADRVYRIDLGAVLWGEPQQID